MRVHLLKTDGASACGEGSHLEPDIERIDCLNCLHEHGKTQRVLRIVPDHHPESPRGDCDVGIMACWHRRYLLGDEQPSESPGEWRDALPEGSVVLPLWLYDHGGLTMSTGSFGCAWDSGQVGWIAATPERIAEHLGPDVSQAQVEDVLRSEVAIYDSYLQGDVWGFVVEDGNGRELDSCYGFYGDDVAGIAHHLEDDVRHLLEEAWEARI